MGDPTSASSVVPVPTRKLVLVDDHDDPANFLQLSCEKIGFDVPAFLEAERGRHVLSFNLNHGHQIYGAMDP